MGIRTPVIEKPAMKRKLRLGLIGTGIAARELYLPAFQRLNRRIEVVACANRTRSKADAYAKLAGVPKVVDSGEELIALPEVDAVIVSLPIDKQPELVLAALGAKKPVLSEKPIAPSLAAGEALLKATRRFKTPWLVGENFAFMPHVLKLREWLDADRLGEVRWIEAVQATWMDSKNRYFNTAWRHQAGFDGGFIADGGVHLANVVRSCFGLPESVQSVTAHFDRKLPAPDTAMAALRFESGALGTWTSCFCARYAGPMLRVYGSKANAELYYGEVRFETGSGKKSRYVAPIDSFSAEFSHFADVVQKGEPLAFTPADALDDLRLIDSLLHSSPSRPKRAAKRARR
jgi:predicted dehydrogenase